MKLRRRKYLAASGLHGGAQEDFQCDPVVDLNGAEARHKDILQTLTSQPRPRGRRTPGRARLSQRTQSGYQFNSISYGPRTGVSPEATMFIRPKARYARHL